MNQNYTSHVIIFLYILVVRYKYYIKDLYAIMETNTKNFRVLALNNNNYNIRNWPESYFRVDNLVDFFIFFVIIQHQGKPFN